MYAAALDSLRPCTFERGLRASAGRTGHRQVWARDSMIALLGGSLTDDGQISDALLASLELLHSRQAATGAIPNNVDSVSLRPNFRAYADGGLWWVIGSSIIGPDLDTIRRIFSWYKCQD